MINLPSKLRLTLGLTAALFMAGCDQQDVVGNAQEAQTQGAESMSAEISELQIIDVETGDGATAEPGKLVVVHYTGWLYEPGSEGNKGTKFDSSVDRGDPFAFPLGAGRVIKGWDEGVAGMQVGGKRTLIIPAEMAYGDRGAGAIIPANATLLFDVELLKVE
jgi:FKBP-type peptidyl-prolyl cis-trans isomerase FkpA